MSFFGTKKDGSFQFYQTSEIERCTVYYLHPFPQMDECIDSLGLAKVSFTLDMYYSYY